MNDESFQVTWPQVIKGACPLCISATVMLRKINSTLMKRLNGTGLQPDVSLVNLPGKNWRCTLTLYLSSLFCKIIDYKNKTASVQACACFSHPAFNKKWTELR